MGILMCGPKLGKSFMGLGFTLKPYIYNINIGL
jgi:hypothetical protein